ncbi:hypothetical protein BST97_02635 [Nonlabens spongiae]|uniref:Uncharacterized protein n=1 Tax=Nonlabens spongiae TaxID=331648 RepID=A0A1W6MP04_9FLAO|nr:hypothetical protein BST97_02635 [Nonlabens spongiae]
MHTDLLNPEVRKYLLDHLTEHPADFLLRSHPFEIDPKTLTQQLVGLQKSLKKFPELHEHPSILFPPKMNLEQTSSASTAFYKSQIVSGNSMVDLTGGWGVDVLAFAKAGFQSTHIERDKELQAYSQHLFKARQLDVKSLNLDGIEYAYEHLDHVDLIYMDPSRKTEKSAKAVRLEDYEPDVLEHLELLLHKCNYLMIKTSPMLDITMGMEQLKHVSHLHVVSVKNEVKELLWILERESVQTQVHCVNLETDQPTLIYNLNKVEKSMEYSAPKNYLYEPNSSIMKAQAFDALTLNYAVDKLDINTHLFTSRELISFPGRIFEIKAIHPYKPKSIKKLFGKQNRGVVTRNFKNSVKELRAKFQIGEDDSQYLFFTQIHGGKPVVIECEKVVH